MLIGGGLVEDPPEVEMLPHPGELVPPTSATGAMSKKYSNETSLVRRVGTLTIARRFGFESCCFPFWGADDRGGSGGATTSCLANRGRRSPFRKTRQEGIWKFRCVPEHTNAIFANNKSSGGDSPPELSPSYHVDPRQAIGASMIHMAGSWGLSGPGSSSSGG